MILISSLCYLISLRFQRELHWFSSRFSAYLYNVKYVKVYLHSSWLDVSKPRIYLKMNNGDILYCGILKSDMMAYLCYSYTQYTQISPALQVCNWGWTCESRLSLESYVINRTWSCYVAWKSFNFFMDLVMLRWCNILGLTNDNSGCWRCNSLFTALIMKHCSLILSALLWFCLWLLTITIILCAAARSYCVSASSGVTLKLPSLKHFMV